MRRDEHGFDLGLVVVRYNNGLVAYCSRNTTVLQYSGGISRDSSSPAPYETDNANYRHLVFRSLPHEADRTLMMSAGRTHHFAMHLSIDVHPRQACCIELQSTVKEYDTWEGLIPNFNLFPTSGFGSIFSAVSTAPATSLQYIYIMSGFPSTASLSSN